MCLFRFYFSNIFALFLSPVMSANFLSHRCVQVHQSIGLLRNLNGFPCNFFFLFMLCKLNKINIHRLQPLLSSQLQQVFSHTAGREWRPLCFIVSSCAAVAKDSIVSTCLPSDCEPVKRSSPVFSPDIPEASSVLTD